MKKRSKFEIVHGILQAVGTGENFSHIVYKTFLNYTVAKKLVSELLSKGLIMKKDNTYYLTEKGQMLLEILKQYKQKKEELDQLLQNLEILKKKEELKQLLQNIVELYGS